MLFFRQMKAIQGVITFPILFIGLNQHKTSIFTSVKGSTLKVLSVQYMLYRPSIYGIRICKG